MLKKAYEWLVRSSANPANLSLTIKGFAPFLLLFGVDQGVLDEGTNAIVSFVVGAGMFASAVVTLLGFVRKVYLSYR